MIGNGGIRAFAFLKAIPEVVKGGGHLVEQFYAHARLRGFFEAIYKAEIPLLYLVISKPKKDGVEVKGVIGTWRDGKENELDMALVKLEENLSVIKASLSVALPGLDLVRIEGAELSEFWDFISVKGNKFSIEEGVSAHTILTPLSELDSLVKAVPSRPRFYIPPPEMNKGIRLGRVMVEGVAKHGISIRPEEVRGHVCILGMTGAGKTNTAKAIVSGLVKSGVPVLILDLHNEYEDVMKDLGGAILAPGRDEFVLNPIEPFKSKELSEHVALITDIFTDVYRFTFPQSFIFRGALMKLLNEDESASGYSHTLGGLVEVIETYPVKSAYDNETKLALLRRLLPLIEGQAGRAMNGLSTFTIDELLSRPVAIQLGHFRDFETRSIFSVILLKMIFDYRTTVRRLDKLHVTVVEEARHVIPARRSEEPAKVGEKMVNELRKFGEGLIFVAQFPSQISHEVVKNSSIRIAHRIAWAEDLRLLAGAMNMSEEQARYLAYLNVGEAVVSLPDKPSPILMKMDRLALNEEVREVSS